MQSLEKLGHVIDADVLIIGGGFAGAWAALRARDFADKVVLVDKSQVAKSGCSTFAAGVQLCPTREDDLDVWKKEIVVSGDYFPDQDWVDFYLKNQIERIEDYVRWGAPLEKDSKGKIARIVGRGHINTRLFQFHGNKLMALLKKKVLERKVEIMERIMITDLVPEGDGSSGRIAGAVGFHARTGEFYIFRAGATIICTGPKGSKLNSPVDNCSGDGTAAAFRAGAELANMEFCTGGNITVWDKKVTSGGINMIQGHGAYFVNALGERFMAKYDPLRMERALLYSLCMSFTKEALEGRGPVYVDMTHFPPETFEKFRRVIPRAMQTWDTLGWDPAKKKMECQPNWNVRDNCGEGGILIDRDCGTPALQGLFAAGAVTRNPVHGIYSLGGVATSSCNVMGYVAGEKAAEYSHKTGRLEAEPQVVEKLKNRVFSPLKRAEGKDPDELYLNLNKTIVPAAFSMFKSGPRIIHILSEIEKFKEEAAHIRADDCHQLVKANEFRNHLLNAELVFRAALERKESRQYHYREDYPYVDNIDWLKLIVLRKSNQGLSLRYEPIPVDKWAVKPERLEKYSHPIPFFLGERK